MTSLANLYQLAKVSEIFYKFIRLHASFYRVKESEQNQEIALNNVANNEIIGNNVRVEPEQKKTVKIKLTTDREVSAGIKYYLYVLLVVRSSICDYNN